MKKKKRIIVVELDKTYAEELIGRKLTKEEVKNLEDCLEYCDDQMWDDINAGLRAAIKDWVEDNI